MEWTVRYDAAFAAEVEAFSVAARMEIAALSLLLRQFGPQLRRPHCDTLNGSQHPNMKELRFTLPDGEWRIAFAFDPERQAILLVGGSKSGTNERRFYRDLIRVADERFDTHLKTLAPKRGGKHMTVSLDDVMQKFTPEQRRQVEARAAELIEEELTLRDLRQARHLTQERMAELMGVEQENVSRLERRADLLLSTLSSYVAAMGGKLRLVAEFPNRHPVVISLADIGGNLPLKPSRGRGAAKELR